MEILYFIQVIQILLLMLRPFDTDSKKEMTGGKLVSMAKMAVRGKMLKGKVKKFGKSITSKDDRDNLKNKLKGLSGTQTSGERLKSASAAVAMYKIIKFIVYFFSALLLPLMPFYAATKAFFKKGIPLFKEVVVPESVDYEKKLIEQELEENKKKKV